MILCSQVYECVCVSASANLVVSLALGVGLGSSARVLPRSIAVRGVLTGRWILTSLAHLVHLTSKQG